MKSFKNISNLRLSRVSKNTTVISITPLPLQFTSSTLTISSYTGNEIYKNGTYNTSSSSMYNVVEFANYLPFNLNPPDGWVSVIGYPPIPQLMLSHLLMLSVYLLYLKK